MTDTLLLAVASAVYPTLLGGVVVILSRKRPVPLLAAFLGGGVLVSLVAGVIIVFALDGAVSTSSRRSASPLIDLALGGLSIGLAAVMFRRASDQRRGRVKPAVRKRAGDSCTRRRLEQATPRVAFGAGLVLNLPGIWYLAGLKDIADADAGPVTTASSELALGMRAGHAQ
jgi:hypothetical protein